MTIPEADHFLKITPARPLTHTPRGDCRRARDVCWLLLQMIVGAQGLQLQWLPLGDLDAACGSRFRELRRPFFTCIIHRPMHWNIVHSQVGERR